MRRRFAVMLLFLAAELAVLCRFALRDVSDTQDTVAVNEVLHAIQRDWGRMEEHRNGTALDYVVLDTQGIVLFRTKPGLSESIHQAVLHRDTVLDISDYNDSSVIIGKVLIWNDSAQKQYADRRMAAAGLGILMILQTGVCLLFHYYLEKNVVRPFGRLKDFAGRVAGGNLDIPLEMDRNNLFGAFTESFDIMREELKKARRAEARANAARKELVAELSHDIRTPVASIQAAAEVGAALAERAAAGYPGSGDKRPDTGAFGSGPGGGNPALSGIRDNYRQIIRKAEQIGILVANLFTATLEEMEQLAVTPGDMQSGELKELLENADYLHRAEIPAIPGCLLYADKMRLQQVFDNLFANSYKYANTEIVVSLWTGGGYLAVEIADHGGGVAGEELPLLKEKFRRGSNAGKAEGAGLGLYVSDYFMKEMQGELLVENGETGLKATVMIRLSGCSGKI